MALLGQLAYRLALGAYKIIASIWALWNNKATKWIAGQNQARQALQELSLTSKTIWVHCASLGEYEQGRPVIDAITTQYPAYHLVLTFFSPSGYEIIKPKRSDATVLYLPLDSVGNANLFLDAVKPSLAIFIKYEHWYFYLAALKARNIPALSISSIFRNKQPFFKWYGAFFSNTLHLYAQLLVQDEQSLVLLKNIGINNVTISGDTRFDRVAAIKQQQGQLPLIHTFKMDGWLLVAGSTWPADEELLVKFINEKHDSFPWLKYVIAPHEISAKHILDLIAKLTVPATTYSAFSDSGWEKVIIIDSIGLLSHMYRYANIVYIGGGFGAGIHNTLEAAVHGSPIVFGPKYQKFNEAVEMIELGAAASINNYEELAQILIKWLDKNANQNAGVIASQYVQQQVGATEKVMQAIRALLNS